MLVALYQEKGESVQPAMQAEATEQTEKTTVEVLFYFEHVYPESVIFPIYRYVIGAHSCSNDMALVFPAYFTQ